MVSFRTLVDFYFLTSGPTSTNLCSVSLTDFISFRARFVRGTYSQLLLNLLGQILGEHS